MQELAKVSRGVLAGVTPFLNSSYGLGTNSAVPTSSVIHRLTNRTLGPFESLFSLIITYRIQRNESFLVPMLRTGFVPGRIRSAR